MEFQSPAFSLTTFLDLVKMEFQSVFSPTAFFLFLFFLFQIIRLWRSGSRAQKLPPGPRKLPLIGNLHHLAAGSSPHSSLRDLAKKYGPFFHLQLGQIPAFVISTPELAKEALKLLDPAFAERPKLLTAKTLFYDHQDMAFSPDGPYWKQMRRICIMELLGSKNVRSFASIREEEAFRMTASVQTLSSTTGTTVNMHEIVTSFTFSVLCRAAFGDKSEYQDAVIPLLNEILAFIPGFNIADVFPSMKFLYVLSGMKSKVLNLRERFDFVLEKIIQDHEKKRQASTRSRNNSTAEANEGDIVDIMLGLKESSDLKFPINNDSIKALILDIITGGVDTSSGTVEWAMSEMMKNSRVMEKAQAELRQVFKGKSKIHENDIKEKELRYLKFVIKETFRLHAPAPLIIRECKEPCNLYGYHIPIKSRVIVNFWAIARNPEYWDDDAEEFKPERFESSSVDYTGNHFEYLPFGAGKRICPGMSFGLANVELPLAQLLYHFNWKLPGEMKPEDLDMSDAHGITVARKNNLCLIATPYDPSLNDSIC